MAYANTKRTLAERDIGFLTISGYGLAAAIGIGAAVVVDLFQHREASALYVINRQIVDLTTLLGVDTIPLYGVMLLLMVVGAGSILFFEPITYRGAFAQGFGVLAALVTVAPSDLGTPLEAPMEIDGTMNFDDSMFDDGAFGDEPLDTGEEARLLVDPPIVPTSLAFAATTTAAAAVQDSTEYQLRIQVEFPEGLKDDFQTMIRRGTLAGKLWNPETGTVYNLFRNSGARMGYRDGMLRIETVVKGVDSAAELWILVEADGYKIQEVKYAAKTGVNRIWNVEMEESGTPLFIQRLRHSYRF